jgi:hypothetical protein
MQHLLRQQEGRNSWQIETRTATTGTCTWDASQIVFEFLHSVLPSHLQRKIPPKAADHSDVCVLYYKLRFRQGYTITDVETLGTR